MTPKKVFFIMTGVLALSFVVLIATIVVGDMLLKKRSDSLLSLKVENRVLDEQRIALVRANKDIEKYAELEKIAKSVVPQDKDQAKTVREIIKIAEENNVPIARIGFPTSTLGAVRAPAAGTTGSTTPTTPSVAPAITQVAPVPGIKGVYQMEITVQSDANKPIPYTSFISFLNELEQNRRTAQVSSINIIPNPKDLTMVTFTLAINVFIKP